MGFKSGFIGYSNVSDSSGSFFILIGLLLILFGGCSGRQSTPLFFRIMLVCLSAFLVCLPSFLSVYLSCGVIEFVCLWKTVQ